MALPNPHRMPRLVGLSTWAVGGVPIGLSLRHASEGRIALTAITYGLFGIAFFLMTRGRPHSRAESTSLLLLQTASALVLAASARSGFEAVCLVLVAAQLGSVFPMPAAMAWCALQTLAYALVLSLHQSVTGTLVSALAYFGFQGFALWAAHVASREAAQRAELQVLYAELRSTQELLAEGSRLGERTRIARDLHDVLGHHLTALSLALEVAGHLSEGRALEEVERARSLARLLLADVRGVVSELRDTEGLDLLPAFRALEERIRSPRVHIAVDRDVTVRDPALAEALLRSAQEIVTNAARHSGAERLDIALSRAGDGLLLRAQDDGRGAAELRPGHGLTGLEERAAALGGRVELSTPSSGGFVVSVFLPDRQGSA